MLNQQIKQVTQRIIDRSQDTRRAYLSKIERQKASEPYRTQLSCGNLAHAFAVCSQSDKELLGQTSKPNIAVVSAYNEMLSAHQPYLSYPEIIRNSAQKLGATSQFAGGVPAMCDGVTQGQPGMELSLFSRDNIAMSTAIALSHQMFDGAAYLGICDKIVPGLLIGALAFGHLPGIFIPAGPMATGISNKEKAKVRQDYAQGIVDEKKLLETESNSYHSAGTCTFYGTANSNQMLMEFMGLQLPGSSFEHPDSELRKPLTESATKVLVENIHNKRGTLAEIVCEKSIVNGVIGLLATGGSTNHTIHLIAIARAAGIILTWQDMSELSKVVPLLARVYPNGTADVNQFHQEGGIAFVIQQLLNSGLLHRNVMTVVGSSLTDYCSKPTLAKSSVIGVTNVSSKTTTRLEKSNQVKWEPIHIKNPNPDILKKTDQPFAPTGGLTLLNGNLGQSVIKTSAVAKEHQKISAPAKVFTTQEQLLEAFKQGKLQQDFVAVVTFQGPKSNGMPELHKFTPILGSLQDQGFKVAIVTDGRMSGASGKVPAAIHLTPEAIDGGPIAKIRDGDLITLDCKNGLLELVKAELLETRTVAVKESNRDQFSVGRELFSVFRGKVNSADLGATIFDYQEEQVLETVLQEDVVNG